MPHPLTDVKPELDTESVTSLELARPDKTGDTQAPAEQTDVLPELDIESLSTLELRRPVKA